MAASSSTPPSVVYWIAPDGVEMKWHLKPTGDIMRVQDALDQLRKHVRGKPDQLFHEDSDGNLWRLHPDDRLDDLIVSANSRLVAKAGIGVKTKREEDERASSSPHGRRRRRRSRSRSPPLVTLEDAPRLVKKNFAKLLQRSTVRTSTSFEQAAALLGDDPAWQALDRRWRKRAFDIFVEQLAIREAPAS